MRDSARNAPLNVFLTVDTEVYPIDPGWRAGRLRADLDRDIYGLIAGHEYGLRYQIQILNHYNLRAVFFVEALFASCPEVGMGPLREIVRQILEGGHDVQMHLHPEWLPFIPHLRHIPSRTLAELEFGFQELLLRTGTSSLVDAGAPVPCAFRSGDYAANNDTLRALARIGYKFDSSYNPCYLDSTCRLRAPGIVQQPILLEGVYEIPISSFSDWPFHKRHLQLAAVSSRELERAIFIAWQQFWWSFVVVSHSFEFITNRWGVKQPKVRGRVIHRFERMCKFLSDNRDRYRTETFAAIKGVAVPMGKTAALDLRGSVFNTLLRYVEQARSRCESGEMALGFTQRSVVSADSRQREVIRLADSHSEYEYVRRAKCRSCGGSTTAKRHGSETQDDVVMENGRLASGATHDSWTIQCTSCGATWELAIVVPFSVEFASRVTGGSIKLVALPSREEVRRRFAGQLINIENVRAEVIAEILNGYVKGGELEPLLGNPRFLLTTRDDLTLSEFFMTCFMLSLRVAEKRNSEAQDITVPLPNAVLEEIDAALKQCLAAVGIDPSGEERRIVTRERAMQCRLILGTNLRSSSVTSAEIEAIVKALLDRMANQASA